VAVVDLQGNKTTLAAGFEDVGRVAWSPDGREVWFSASQGSTAVDHAIFAVTLDGKMRQLVNGPGHFALQDVSPAGDILVAHGMRRAAIVARAPGGTDDVELGWLDFSILADISDDGGRILFAEQAVGGGPGYAVYMRKTDGSPAVRLGKGDAHSLSNDGQWALAHDLTSHTLELLPTGAGQARKIPNHGMAAYPWSGFLPGDKSIVFMGTDKAGINRMYVQDLEGGAPRPVTPESVTVDVDTVSPDGKWLMAVEGDDLRLFPLGGGESRPVTGAKPGDEPLRWSANPNLVFVARRAGAVMQVESIDITRGTRTPMMEVSVRDRVGASGVQRLVLSADGKSYAYLYTRTLQNLYVVKNVK
jgi:Tol biopolymer transport system component